MTDIKGVAIFVHYKNLRTRAYKPYTISTWEKKQQYITFHHVHQRDEPSKTIIWSEFFGLSCSLAQATTLAKEAPCSSLLPLVLLLVPPHDVSPVEKRRDPHWTYVAYEWT